MICMLWRPNDTNNRFTPPYDVIELEDQINIVIEVAGVKPSDLKLHLANQRLVIGGIRHRPVFENAAHHRVEIGYGEFRLDITLPWTVEQDGVSASYKDGFLQVELPRRAETQIRVVNVEDRQDKAPDDE